MSLSYLLPHEIKPKQIREVLRNLLTWAWVGFHSDYSATRNPDVVHTDVLSASRQACYKVRDAFYDCLENESDKKQSEIGFKGLLYPAQCKPARDQYCRTSWVKHFDALHCKSRSMKRLLDDKESRRGPLSLPQPYTFKPPTTS